MSLGLVLRNAFTNLAHTFTWQDALDILLMAFIVYELISLVMRSRVKQLMFGLVIVVIAYLVARAIGLRTVSYVFSNLFQVGVIVLVIMFQPELRRALEKVGSSKTKLNLFDNTSELMSEWQYAINAICEACEHMSASRTGALIVIERGISLSDISNSGTIIDSDISANLIETIFYEGSPLHDGAVTVKDGRLQAAGCVLPLTTRMDIDRDMGTRHRAGIGMSENSDAVVVIVSEETGIISLARNGNLQRHFSRATLKDLLVNELIPEPAEKQPLLPKIKSLLSKKHTGEEKHDE